MVLTLADIDVDSVRLLLARYRLKLIHIPDFQPILGSYWGEPEAGLIGSHVYARNDTPVHSILHETCHLIVKPENQRTQIHTDASDCQREEDAACYLQIILADQLTGVGRQRMMHDMDVWGYSFRLGSAKAWFIHDAEEARLWLTEQGLLINPKSKKMRVSAVITGKNPG